MEEFRPGARLCHGLARRGERTRRALRIAAAALAALSLIGLSGCSGAADAAPTVGPTAGADEPVEPAEYEPSVPPYTSEVDLSAEDEAEVEELLLLIDEFNMLTAILDEGSVEEAELLDATAEQEILEGYISEMKSAYSDGKRTTGFIESDSAVVLEFSEDQAVIATCYDYSDYVVHQEGSEGDHLYPDKPNFHALDTTANRVGQDWKVSDQGESEIPCG